MARISKTYCNFCIKLPEDRVDSGFERGGSVEIAVIPL